uniref:glutamyl aminopeptidase n=1 Tax=Ixodes ricinus TaxID=34613 RepID=A0A147BG10_IXORI
MQAFFLKNPNAGAGKRAREQALENVRNNIAWIMLHEPKVARWLTTNIIPEPWESIRLPRHVIPISYDIRLEPVLAEDLVHGSSSIRIAVAKATNVLMVHIKNINVSMTKVKRLKRGNFEDVSMDEEPFLYAENDFWVVQSKDVLAPGVYVLEFEFTSSMLNHLRGIFRTSYWDTKTQSTKYMVTSQFQPTFARMAFPCFDEPSFKANFTITVVHAPDMKAISNMPVKEIRELDDTRVATKFQESHKMTTYLVAVVVCDFDYLSGVTSNGTPVRVYAREEMLSHAKYALSSIIQVLELFEQQFAIQFPLPKIDNIAIPDPQAAAMENWGLVTYSEFMLLYNPNTTSVSDHHNIAEIVSHELAHMWFGNLVTMKWWDDLWLNEGFATYNSYKGIELIEPSWDADSQFLLKLISGVLEKDAVLSSHSIVMPVSNPNEIFDIFDVISYNKGSAVIRMLESFMGTRDFNRGIQNYLKNRKRSNAVTLDLWKSLENVSTMHQHITTIMNTWTRQMGFPYVSVRRGPGNSSFYQVSQQRFLLNPDDATNLTNDSPFRYIWEIPLSFKTSEKRVGLHWLRTNNTDIVKIPLETQDSWVKFNSEFKGYYLVKYDLDDLKLFAETLSDNHEELSASDRAELILETFLLARAGVTPYPAAMDLTRYLRRERHFIPLTAASRVLRHIAMCMRDYPERDLFQGYLRYIAEEAFEEFTWRDRGDHLTKRAREVILDLSCFSGDPICLKNAGERLKAWIGGSTISPNLRQLVYVWGMVEIGNETIWDAMLQRYLAEPMPAERKKLIKGLASVRDSSLIERLLQQSLNESVVKKEDFRTLIEQLATNELGLQRAWNFVRTNWELLVQRYTLTDKQLGNVLYSICQHFTTEVELRKMEQFFDEYTEAGMGKRARLQALETVRGNIRWRANFPRIIVKWIKEYQFAPWENLRLPTHVVPVHYDLQLQPFLEEQWFQGQVDIEIELLKPVSSVSVHSKNLNITSAFMTAVLTKTMVPLAKMFFYEENEFYVMQLDTVADIGKYSLHYEFRGSLTRDLRGLYLSSYQTPENETRYLATTQFEPTDARKAFPCFDEPRFKATFSIKLIHDPAYIALSNMPVIGTEITTTGLQITHFEKTVNMTTYLVAVIVCDFTHISGNSTGGVQVRVFARKEEIDKTEYALGAALKVLTYFEEYFAIKYPLPKLDLIAIPDFSSGAMENWGLITFREARLLYGADTSSSLDVQNVCRVIAHEIAHMWFGNLVTMQWWDDLWLNEGFASYIQYKGMNHAEPEWESMALFTTVLIGVLEPDSVISSHPIIQPVRNPSEISSLFDAISYSKGSSVLRMLENFMSEEDFRRGVSKYLKKHEFGNTITFDLWDELEASSSSDLSISSIMEGWTKQMGFPVISVERNGTSFIMSQSRFLMNPDTAVNSTDSPYRYIWQIPLTYRTSEGSTGLVWLKRQQQKFTIDVPENGWIKFNNNMTGVYFIKYDKRSLHLIEDAMNHDINVISPSDRAELLFETFSLARAGHVSYMSALNLSKYIINEPHYVPWATFSAVASFLHHRLFGTETGKQFKLYVRTLLTEVLKGLTFSDTGSHLERLMRSIVYKIACRYGEKTCLHAASDALKGWLDGELLEPNFKDIVFHYGMKQIGDEATWELLFERFLNEPNHAEKGKMITGLGQVQNKALLTRFLNYTFDESKIRGQDIVAVFLSVSKNPAGHEVLWRFLRDNWKSIVKKYAANSRIPGNLIKVVCSDFNTKAKMKEMLEFFAQHPDAGASKQPREQCLHTVQNNIDWISKFEPKVSESVRVLLS